MKIRRQGLIIHPSKFARIMLILYMVIAVSALTACSTLSKQAGPEAAAVPFQIDGLDGSVLDSSQIDKPMFINFWATWCPYCKEEMPFIETLYKEYGQLVEFAAVDLIETDTVKAVHKYVEEHSYTMPIYLDYDNIVSSQFRVNATPTAILLDKSGKVVYVMYGPGGEESIDDFRSLLDGMLE